MNAARSLALITLGAALALGFSAPREALLKPFSALNPLDDNPAGRLSAGGPILASGTESAQEREQRAMAEFIAKRYRVSQDAVAGFVSAAYRAGSEFSVDPLLILAVMAVESKYNPVAESVVGAKGLMQIIPKYHLEKLYEHGGEDALLVPDVNISVGAQILREYTRRFGGIETALQMYAGAFDEVTSQYSAKVLAERARLEQVRARLRRQVA